MTESHQVRTAAEGFGADAQRYDRTRPRYPDALVADLVAAMPGPRVLDVGCGTGIAARQLAAAGCAVLGVDVDARMVELARSLGVTAEVATLEDWDPAGRTFDAVVAGQTWHWVEPVAGAAKAAAVLPPDGLVALFWNVMQPPSEVGEAFAEAYRRVLPDQPAVAQAARAAPDGGLGAYETILDRAAAGLASAPFSEPLRSTYPWERRYTREEWLEQVPTFGGFSAMPAETQQTLLAAMGDAVDQVGGGFTMRYTAVALTALRQSA